SALTYLGGKLVLFLHSSILSDVGASTKPGAVQWHQLIWLKMETRGIGYACEEYLKRRAKCFIASFT
ncbi:hypothetical protein, partial [Nitrosospira multiformis]|uniref:hypothetical protein n=1 Tax=Nitrosospira multiformis TaxID=1231 RepID=UPI001C62DA99